jgi:hypothetical protein
MKNKFEILLGSKKNKTSINVDSTLDVLLNSDIKEIDEFDRNSRIDLAQVFEDERNSSNVFRLTANLDFLYYNAYLGTTGLSGYTPFRDNLFYVNAEDSFGTSSWSGYPQHSEFDFIRMDYGIPFYTTSSGQIPAHVQFINDNATNYNWSQYVSYVYENDFTRRLEYNLSTANTQTWICSEGIPFTIINPYFSDGIELISFVCPMEHGLTEGEYVHIEFIYPWTGYRGSKIFQVYSLGNEAYNSDKYIFNIENFGFTGTSFYNDSQGTFKRIIDIENSAETMSKYYVRKHKILTNYDESILTFAGFEQNAFPEKKEFNFSSLTPNNISKITKKESNKSYLLSFSKDIDISKLRDNWNRPVSELFITIINRGYFGWFSKPVFRDIAIKEGYGFNLTNFVSPYWRSSNFDINLSKIGTQAYVKPNNFIFYYNEFLKSGETMNGDFCEFNEYDGKERKISDLYHKIAYNEDIFKIDTDYSNPNGFYYKPHHSITLRVYSDYQEEGSTQEVDNIPDYAFFSNYKQKFIWRDLYTYGFIDDKKNGVDYPFLNGTHYPYKKVIFRLMPEGFIGPDIISITPPAIDECE